MSLESSQMEALDEASLEINNSFRYEWREILALQPTLTEKGLAMELIGKFEKSINLMNELISQIAPVGSTEDPLFQMDNPYEDYLRLKNPFIHMCMIMHFTAVTFYQSLGTDAEIDTGFQVMVDMGLVDSETAEDSSDYAKENARSEYDIFKNNGLVHEICSMSTYTFKRLLVKGQSLLGNNQEMSKAIQEYNEQIKTIKQVLDSLIVKGES